MNQGLLFVICGPSGAGKGTIYGRVLGSMPEIQRSISVTTRSPRPSEVEGVNYYFRNINEYRQMIAEDGFLETANVFDNYYGTPKAPVLKMLDEGRDVLFEIDVVGAKQIKAKYPGSILVFVMTPDFATLEQRLRGRGTESGEGLKTRLSAARNELAEYPMFDYIVINDDLDRAVSTVESIIIAERSRVKFNLQKIEKILSE